MVKCLRCGSQETANSKFCSTCGNSLAPLSKPGSRQAELLAEKELLQARCRLEPEAAAAPEKLNLQASRKVASALEYGWMGKVLWTLVVIVFAVLLIAAISQKAPVAIGSALLAVFLLNPYGLRKVCIKVGLGTTKSVAVLATALLIGSSFGMLWSIDPEGVARDQVARAQAMQVRDKASLKAREEKEKAEQEQIEAAAKMLGFESSGQQKTLQARGYKTFADYALVKSLTPGVFMKTCLHGVSRAEYREKCYGKKVVWKALLRSISSKYGASLKLFNDDGSIPSGEPVVESKSLAKLVTQADVDRIVTFEGVIDAQNVVTPDIEEVVLLSIADDSGKAGRDARSAQVRQECEQEAMTKGVTRYLVNGKNGSASDLEMDLAHCLNERR